MRASRRMYRIIRRNMRKYNAVGNTPRIILTPPSQDGGVTIPEAKTEPGEVQTGKEQIDKEEQKRLKAERRKLQKKAKKEVKKQEKEETRTLGGAEVDGDTAKAKETVNSAKPQEAEAPSAMETSEQANPAASSSATGSTPMVPAEKHKRIRKGWQTKKNQEIDQRESKRTRPTLLE